MDKYVEHRGLYHKVVGLCSDRSLLLKGRIEYFLHLGPDIEEILLAILFLLLNLVFRNAVDLR
jgi:hypothetical protein